jgi:hypothetical protein
MIQNTDSAIKPKQETPYKFSRRIGSTNYNVAVHFSKTSRENMTDKILRLVKNDMTAKK